MFDLKEIAGNQSVAATEKAGNTSSAPVRSPLGSNYYRKGEITNTSSIELVLCVAYRMMASQGCEIVPVEVMLSVADMLGLDVRTVKKTAVKRIREHIEALDLASVQSARFCKIEGKGKSKTETPYTVQGFLLSPETFEQVDNVIFDFPAV